MALHACRDQPERFDMLEMDIEMPDVAAQLQLQAEAAEADMQSDKEVPSQGDVIVAPPAPLTPPPPGGEMDLMGADDAAEGMHASPKVGQELQRAAQVCTFMHACMSACNNANPSPNQINLIMSQFTTDSSFLSFARQGRRDECQQQSWTLLKTSSLTAR